LIKRKEALAENEKPTSVLLISLLLTLGQSPILGEKQKKLTHSGKQLNYSKSSLLFEDFYFYSK